MRLMHPLLTKPILWNEGRVPVLVVESPHVFQNMVFDLSQQSEGEEGSFVLSSHNIPLDGSEHLRVIRDYVFLSLDNRKLQNHFHTWLQTAVSESFLRETEELNQSIGQYLEELTTIADYPTAFLHGDYVGALLKSQKFQPVLDGETPLERLMQYIELYAGLMKEQCFVLVSAKSYFDESQLRQLYKMAAYEKWNLLLLENHAYPPFVQEDCCVIDADLCELRLDSSDIIL